MQIGEDLLDIMHHTRFFAGLVEQAHQFRIAGAVQLIPVCVGADVLFLQTGEVLIQLGVEIFPAALPEGQPHIETQDTLYSGVNAAI